MGWRGVSGASKATVVSVILGVLSLSGAVLAPANASVVRPAGVNVLPVPTFTPISRCTGGKGGFYRISWTPAVSGSGSPVKGYLVDWMQSRDKGATPPTWGQGQTYVGADVLSFEPYYGLNPSYVAVRVTAIFEDSSQLESVPSGWMRLPQVPAVANRPTVSRLPAGGLNINVGVCSDDDWLLQQSVNGGPWTNAAKGTTNPVTGSPVSIFFRPARVGASYRFRTIDSRGAVSVSPGPPSLPITSLPSVFPVRSLAAAGFVVSRGSSGFGVTWWNAPAADQQYVYKVVLRTAGKTVLSLRTTSTLVWLPGLRTSVPYVVSVSACSTKAWLWSPAGECSTVVSSRPFTSERTK